MSAPLEKSDSGTDGLELGVLKSHSSRLGKGNGDLDWLRFPSGNPMHIAPCAFSHHNGHDDRHFTH
jgi:hypothetical protein